MQAMNREKPSRYRVISKDSFRTRSGETVRLVYATRVSKVLTVSPEVAEALESGRLESLSDEELERLQRYELLVPHAQDELAHLTERFEAAAADRSRRHITLLPSSYCNMGCSYCGQTHRQGTLRGNHRDAVRQRVTRIMQDPQTHSVRLDWFGAEPLMGFAAIRDLSRSFVPIIEERALTWSSVIVTNGALLDGRKLRTLARECRVTHAEITIDGPPGIHDVHRPLKSGGKSFWRIVHSVAQALHDPAVEGLSFGIRTNVDVHNQEHVEELLRLLAAEGFAHPRVRFGIKPVHSWGNDVSEIRLDNDSFASKEIYWMEVMRELGLNFTLLPTEPADVLCPAVSRSDEMITADGAAFSCSEQPLVDHLASTSIGNVTNRWAEGAGPRPLGAYDDWHQDVASGERPCSSCEFYATCGGACPKLWREGHWPCPSYKFSTQERLALVAEMNGMTRVHGDEIGRH